MAGFEIGERVKCVDASEPMDWPDTAPAWPLVQGEIYSVRGFDEVESLLLVEVCNPGLGHVQLSEYGPKIIVWSDREIGFHRWRFRKLPSIGEGLSQLMSLVSPRELEDA